MNRLLKYALAVIAVFSVFSCCFAADTVKVYFRIGNSTFDPSFGDNGRAMSLFLDKLKAATDDNAVDSIIIRGAASPDGGNKLNERLSIKRGKAVADYIVDRSGINPDLITIIPEGIAWGELRNLVAANPDVPAREKVLDILDNTPVWVFDSKGVVVSGRKKQLMDLNGGRPYNWMYTHIFPELRNALMIALVLKTDATTTPDHTALKDFKDSKDLKNPIDSKDLNALDNNATALSDSKDLNNVNDTKDLKDLKNPKDLNALNDAQTLKDSKDLKDPIALNSLKKPFYMALKTNMLFDAALAPNIGAEFYVGKNFSVYGQWVYAWWSKDNRHRYWQIYGGDAGVRWWFGKKAEAKPLTGHHVGIYMGAFIFDFEWGDTGYMGGKPGGSLWQRCMINSGIEYGYSLPVGRRLNIDFSIGLGFMGGKYTKYFPFDNDYYRQKEYNLRFFGPTKAEISLVWLLGHGNTNNRKGGNQ